MKKVVEIFHAFGKFPESVNTALNLESRSEGIAKRSSACRTIARDMRKLRTALRLSVPRFARVLGTGEMILAARENRRSRWPGSPLHDYRRKIEAELARMERDIAAVRTLLAEATPPAAAPSPSPKS